MNVIFGQQNASLLDKRYLILELEKFHGVDCFCAISYDQIPNEEMPQLAYIVKLHRSLVHNLREENYAVCQELVSHLMGKFGGELDTFYQEVLRRSS